MPPETQPERTETGEIKEPVKTEVKIPEKVETKSEQKPEVEPKVEAKEGETKSLLNEKDPSKAEGAPEKYEDFKPPTHWADKGLELDPTAIAEALPLFKELGLSQDQAQKMIDLYAKVSEKNSDSAVDSMLDMRKGWRDEVKADADLGRKLPEVKTTISKAIDGLGDAKLATAFREAMDLTGAGDHPAFIKAFYKLAQQVTEGSHVTGGGPSKLGQVKPGSAPESAAKALYPNLA